MFDKLIDAAFGPSQGPANLLRQLLKFALCIGAAFGVHSLAFNMMTNLSFPEAASISIMEEGSNTSVNKLLTPDGDGRINVIGEILEASASQLKVKPFDIALCGSSSVMRRPCDDERIILGVVFLPRDTAEGITGTNAEEVKNELEYPIVQSVLGLAPVVSVQHSSQSVAELAPAVSIQHSVHSITRQIEAVAFNEPGTPASALKLCAGTRRALGRDECQVGAQIEEAIGALIRPAINDARWATLLLGPIQLITIALFFFVNLEAFGRLRRYALLDITLLEEVEGKDGKSRFELPKEQDLDRRIQTFNASNTTSIMDEMIAYAILSKHQKQAMAVQQVATDELDGGPPLPAGHTDVAKVATLEGFRDNMVGEAEAKIEPLESMNETMMKLAFIGTVIGIGMALMTARSLDAANPVDEMLTKAAMFGAIGSAFGTTLLGVSLSIVASTTIQTVSGKWLGRIYDAFRTAVDQSRRIDPSLASKYERGLRQKFDKIDQAANTFTNIGYLAVVGGIIWAIYNYAL